MKKVLLIFGTRPEAIKMAPLIKNLESHEGFDVRVCVTGQHRDMLDQVLDLFEIIPDYDLDIMSHKQNLYSITAKVLIKLEYVLDDYLPDIVLVHGDTSTTFAAALASYYKKVQIGHIEAGLRTGNIYSPWPEEANRRLTSSLANLHFAPTKKAKTNLLIEGVPEEKIFVTGNTVIDALFWVKNKLKNNVKLSDDMSMKFKFLDKDKKLILVTGHRRENFGDGFLRICNALLKIAKLYPDIQILYPVHLNPNVQDPVNNLLSKTKNIFLIEPQEYSAFCYLMTRSYLILTDSGGIQEEAPSLGKPVLVMRDTTERPEAIETGSVKLVGTNENIIVSSISMLIEDKNEYEKMSSSVNPYGDGKASEYIVDAL